MKPETLAKKCRCGARLHQSGQLTQGGRESDWLTQAGYVTDPGRRHEKSHCCIDCALGVICLCAELSAPVTTPRLDALLFKLDGRKA